MIGRLMQLMRTAVGTLWNDRNLILAFTRRDILGKYRGTGLGLMWSVLNPLLLLAVYALIFGMVFQSRWPDSNGFDVHFIASLFCGISVFTLFSQVLNRSPGLMRENVNYIKKVVFPLDVLCWMFLSAALFHFLIAIVLLILFILISGIGLSVSLIVFPILLFVYALFLAGLNFFLSAIGVYIRDLKQVSGFLSTALLFLSPIFYPATRIPVEYRDIYMLNPLAYFIESFRQIMIGGEYLDAMGLLRVALFSMAVFILGYAFFYKVKRGFADVL